MKRSRRYALPILLVFIGVYLLIGCIPIPATRQLQPDFTPRPEHYVGKRNDDPIHLGVTHIDDAYIFLSQHVKPHNPGPNLFAAPVHYTYSPQWVLQQWSVSSDGRRFSMAYSIRTATWIAPLCFTAWAETAQRWITFDVDENGVIINSITTDHPIIGRVENPTQWLEIFDAQTRRKLYDAAVFPSDDALRQSQLMADHSRRRWAPPPTTVPASAPELQHHDTHWTPANTRPATP
jgi:hypothetical protein